MVLAPNQPSTFYRGAGRIASFRGHGDPLLPEDWIASTTARHGHDGSGLSRLPDGTTLVDAIAMNPGAWVGGRPSDANVLVKLLDAGQRLPLHAHPTRDFARQHFQCPFGKTEAWLILEAGPDAAVRLGFTRDVALDELRQWVEAQNTAAMLAATNRIPVSAGDAILCPAGMPHAIDAGVLLLEIQEPTDFSLLLEWRDFASDAKTARLGLSVDDALACVDRSACTPARLEQLRSARPGALFPDSAEEFFRVDQLEAGHPAVGFAVLVVVRGDGTLQGDWGTLTLAKGTTIVVPAAAGPYALSGAARVIRCRGPIS